MLRIKSFVLIIIFGLFANFSQIAMASAASEKDVRDFLDGFLQRTFSLVDTRTITKNLVQKSEDILTSCIDYRWLGTFVMGNIFNVATEEQKTRLIEEYRMQVVYTYLPLIMRYKKVQYDIRSIQNAGNDTFLISVNVRCVNCNGKPINIIYRVKHNNNSCQYHIYDIVIEGISFLVTQRNAFKHIVVNTKSVDDVINKMHRENTRMQNSILGRG